MQKQMLVTYLLTVFIETCCTVKDVKLIPGEEVVSQHHLLVMEFLLKK